MTPNAEGTLALQHLTAAATLLRGASARLCDYVAATRDEAGQDVAGQPPRGDCGVVDGSGISRGAPTAPAPSSPAIPLGAVVEVAGDDDAPYTFNGAHWHSKDVYTSRDSSNALTALYRTALYRARREAAELREQRDKALDDCVALGQQRDKAQSALATERARWTVTSETVERVAKAMQKGPMIRTYEDSARIAMHSLGFTITEADHA